MHYGVLQMYRWVWHICSKAEEGYRVHKFGCNSVVLHFEHSSAAVEFAKC